MFYLVLQVHLIGSKKNPSDFESKQDYSPRKVSNIFFEFEVFILKMNWHHLKMSNGDVTMMILIDTDFKMGIDTSGHVNSRS